MRKVRLFAAIILALPLLVFPLNSWFEFFEQPELAGAPEGIALLEAMIAGGLMKWIAASHVLLGVCLLIPRTRFLAGLLQLPVTLGIVAFHMTMLPEGNVTAFIMLALNLIVVFNVGQLQRLVAMKLVPV